MDGRQILRHWQMPLSRVRRSFDQATCEAIEAAIGASEKRHRGELRFVIEGRFSLPQLLRGLSPRQAAQGLFKKLGVGQTAEQTGILIYVLLAEQRVEIVADHGIAQRVAQARWDALCADMTRAFAAGEFRAGALAGIAAATALLAEHFPAPEDNPNELDDVPVIL